MVRVEISERHTALATAIRDTGGNDMPPAEVLAVLAQVMGMGIHMLDREDFSPARAMALIEHNVKIGFDTVITTALKGQTKSARPN